MKFSQKAKQAAALFIAAALIVPLGAATATAAAATEPLRREVSREKPLFLTNFYKDGEGPDKTDTINDLWGAVPDDLKENTALLLIAGEGIRNKASVTDWLEAQADAAEDADIPFYVQAVNGETPAAERIPASFFRTMAETHTMMQGVNGAELYNSASFTGSNHSDYLAELVQLSADEGLQFVWSDTNIWGATGTMMQWMQDNATLLSTIRANPDNVIFINKESFGDTDTDALNLGMWLSGSIGNWGSASDWWHWGLNGYGRLWGTGGQAWKDILQYPEAMTVQSMLKVASQGGTVFKTEAQWFTNVTDGQRLAGYEFAIIPFLRDLKSGAIHIPTKAEVLAQNKVVYKGGVYNDETIWDTSASNIFPRTGRYGIIPMVPDTIPDADLSMFENIAKESKNQAWFDALYPSQTLSSNTFMLANGDTWYWMNYAENREAIARSAFKPKKSAATSVGVEASNHTFAVLTESDNKLDVIVNNYRVNKDNVRTDTIYATAPASDFDKWKTYRYITDYTSVKLNSAGDPVKDASGNITTASNLTLNDRSSRDIRTTTFTVDGAWQGGKPEVTYQADTTATRPYTHTETWDAVNKRLTVKIVHNGLVKFSVKTDGAGGPASANLAKGKTATQSTEWPFALTAGRAVDGNTNGVFSGASVSHTQEGQANPWWKVDLGSVQSIGDIQVWNRTDCCSDRLANYKVEVLDAASAVVWSSTRTGYPTPSETISTGGVQGRYVKISLVGTSRTLSLAEVIVRPGPAANLALGKTATQSSTYTGGGGPGPAARGVDGNTDGNFANGSVTHTNTEADPWWQVDLGAVKTINQVEVWGRTDCCSSRASGYRLEILDDAGVVVWSTRALGFPAPSDVINTGGVQGRYVKVSVPGTGKILSLAEVLVH